MGQHSRNQRGTEERQPQKAQRHKGTKKTNHNDTTSTTDTKTGLDERIGAGKTDLRYEISEEENATALGRKERRDSTTRNHGGLR